MNASEQTLKRAKSFHIRVVRMSEAVDAAGRFDRTAEFYDETREPMAEEAAEKAALVLSRDGCRRILEVGVGTGRIASRS